MEAFIAKKKALNSKDDDTLTPCPDVSDNLSKPLPSRGTLGSSLDSKATTVTVQARSVNLHKGAPTPSLSCSVPSIPDLSLQEPGCESSRFLGAAATKSTLSDSPDSKTY